MTMKMMMDTITVVTTQDIIITDGIMWIIHGPKDNMDCNIGTGPILMEFLELTNIHNGLEKQKHQTYVI